MDIIEKRGEDTLGKAIFKQNLGILGVAVAAQCGVVTAEQLKALGELAEEVEAAGIKFTTRQTLVILIPEDKLKRVEEAVAAMGLRIGNFGSVIRNIKGCCGHPNFCNRYLADALTLGIELQEKYMDQPVPKDFKISTAGCGRGCTDPYCADFGVVGVANNLFDIYIGGRGGSKKPTHGERIAERVSKEKVFEILDYILAKYREHGLKNERLCNTIKRVGSEAFSLPKNLTKSEDIIENDFLAFLEAN